ncbi:MAG: DUF58 domain-containing protein [Dehalococcoidia bacterium]
MLLRHAWLPLGAVLVGAGFLASNPPLLSLGLFVLLAGALARLWADRALTGVEFERRLPENRAFPGEHLTVVYRLSNRKLLPLPRVELRDWLPEALADSAPASMSGAVAYPKTTNLGPRERKSWTLDLPCPQRGYYRLGPATLRSGDGFGLFTSEREEPSTAGVVVYPRTVPLPDLGLPSARPIGDRKGRQWIFDDPLRIAGIRDYQPGDSIRRIDWNATARRGQLQSRVYEPSTTPHVIVALNVDTLERPWQGYVPDLLEAGIVQAASVARWAFDQRYAVGLLANGSFPESDRPVRIPPGRTPDHLIRVLEALGGIGPLTLTSLADVLEQERHRLPFGATLAVVTALADEPLAAVLRRLHAFGHHVVVLATSVGPWTELLGAVPLLRVDAVMPEATEART